MEGENITVEEQDCVDRLRQALPTEKVSRLDDFYLVRFLRARKGKYEGAKEMLEQHFEWRAKHNVDSLLENPPAKAGIMKKLWGGCVHKTSRSGGPVLIVPYGMFLTSGVQEHVSIEEYPAVTAYIMEGIMKQMEEMSKEQGRRISKITTIFDMEGLNFSARPMYGYVRMSSAINADHYPEALGTLFLVNCPWVFPTLFNVVKPLLDPVVKSKMSIHQDVGGGVLHEQIHPDNLPVRFGGNCTEYKRPNIGEHKEQEPENLESVSVAAGDLLERTLQAGPEGGVFGWYFTVNSDVDFSVQFFESLPGGAGASETPVEVFKSTRVKGGKLPTVGSYSSHKQGHCKFVWSNEHSIFRSKQLTFSVSCSDLMLQEKDTDEASADNL